MNIKTTLLSIISVTFGIYLSSCSKRDGFDCAIGCQDKDGKMLGSVVLNDSNEHWLDFNYPYSWKFGNTSGYFVYYKTYKSSGYDKKYLSSTARSSDEPCCSGYRIEDYIAVGNEVVSYEPEESGLSFTITRTVNARLSAGSPKNTAQDEVLIMQVNGTSLVINPDSTYSSDGQKFHSSIKLDGREYQSVFEVIDTNSDSTKILPKGVYFVFGGGIVGYYLSNNELWTLK